MEKTLVAVCVSYLAPSYKVREREGVKGHECVRAGDKAHEYIRAYIIERLHA